MTMGFVQGQAIQATTSADTAAAVAGLPAEPLDPQAIERLRELDPLGQTGVLRRVLEAYHGSLARHVGDITQAAAAGDLDRMARAAHTLKSSSASVGAAALSQHCVVVEHEARGQRQLPAAARLEALVHEAGRVRAAVEAMLAP